MSKAFLRESDDEGDDPILLRPSALPPGAKNLMTAEGERRLRARLETLQGERQPLTGDADAETRRKLQVLDQKIRLLEASLRTAEVVPIPPPPWDVVRLGATVKVKDAAGAHSHYRIVGVDEADAARSWVSWQSPIARALLNAKVGDRVPFTFPRGQTELEILNVRFDSPES